MTEKKLNNNDKYFMGRALHYAALAARRGETPVGAVIVCDGEIVSWGYNLRETKKSALAHAEIIALSRANKALDGWRLHKCDLYVTMEPCPMCAGAIVNARIRRVVYGCADSKAGSFGSVLSLNDFPLNHKPEIVGGVMAEESRKLLSDFFRSLRAKKSADKNAGKQ
ncbi:MAG: tRNA adenosine(34) deaminase TadA [Oscillospiraceae bacterium]|nr:tRNA adenosine(34) deaminase TadA [Oscillospiraceae bacterium]